VTEAEPAAEAGVEPGLTLQQRRTMLGVIAIVVVVTAGLVLFIGNRQADHEVARIRARASTVRVDMPAVLDFAFNNGENPVARALDVDSTDVALALGPPTCASVRVKKWWGRRLYVVLDSQGRMTVVPRCPH
jgi:hypothetical protein